MAPSSTAVFLAEHAVTGDKQQMHKRPSSAVKACWYSTGLTNLAYLQNSSRDDQCSAVMMIIKTQHQWWSIYSTNDEPYTALMINVQHVIWWCMMSLLEQPLACNGMIQT